MTWQDLQSASLTGKDFVTWSNLRPQFCPFKVVGVSESKIIFLPSSNRERSLPRTRAEEFMAVWEQYRSGLISRRAFHDQNRNLSYLAGVLKALDKGDL